MHVTDLYASLDCDIFVVDSLLIGFIGTMLMKMMVLIFSIHFTCRLLERDTDTVHSCGVAWCEESLAACFSPSPSTCLWHRLSAMVSSPNCSTFFSRRKLYSSGTGFEFPNKYLSRTTLVMVHSFTGVQSTGILLFT